MWEQVLHECRTNNKEALAARGRSLPRVERQEMVSDKELITQIKSLGAFDHPHFKRLMAEAHQRWG